MRRIVLVPVAGLLLLAGCNGTKKPSNVNFTKAINQYLAQHGDACTSIGRQFPVDIPASAQRGQYGIEPRLIALQEVGLVSEGAATAVVHGMLGPLRGAGPPQPVRRYQLTAEGQEYVQQVPGTFGRTAGFCYGQKSVDSIVDWSAPTAVEGVSRTVVTYKYKIVNLAVWADQPDIRHAFPDIGATVSGASKTNQTAGLQLTSDGWEVAAP